MSYTEEIPITKTAASHVVGKGGETIKGLKAQTNTQINIEGEVVKVTGEQDDVLKAKELILKIIEEQANPDYEGPEGKRLRSEADKAGTKRDDLKSDADKAFKDGDKDKGHKLMAEANEWKEKMYEFNKQAAAAILKNRNEGKGDAYLDLHGLRTEEAIDATKARIVELEQKSKDTTTELELIPGAGHHSAPGKVALKPACAQLLQEMKLQYRDESAGSFMVTVPGKGDASATPAAAAEPAVHPATETKKDEDKKEPAAKKEVVKKESKEEGKGCCIIM